MALDWNRIIAVSDDGTVDAFGIERIVLVTGGKGDKGEPGGEGEAATIDRVEAVTLSPESDAYVINEGDEHHASLVFGIPKGDSGDAEWGNISGNLADQTDLIEALNGKVAGPVSSTDAHIAVFNGETGKVIKDSGFTIGKSVPADAEFTDTKYSASTTSVGSASEGTAIKADDITAWSAGSVPTFSVSNGVLTITPGTLPSLTYTEKTIPNISVSSKTVVSGITAS